MDLHAFLKRTEKLAADNSPAILTAIGVVGTLGTAYLTGKATLKASELIRAEERQISLDRTGQPDNHFTLTRKEKAQLLWKLYLPAAGVAALTVTCIIGANRIGTRRAAAMAAAYSLSERAFTEYKHKVVEKLGEKKEQQVRDEVAQDRVNRNPLSANEVIFTGKGKVLIYDSISGRYFESSKSEIEKAEIAINKQILDDMNATLYEFYELIGLAPTPYSSEVGWNCDNMLEVRFSSTIAEDGETPCLTLEYQAFPTREYHLLH